MDNGKVGLAAGGQTRIVVKMKKKKKTSSLATSIFYSNDATEFYAKKMYKERQIYNVKRKVKSPQVWRIRIFTKNEKEQETFIQTIRIYS